MKNSYLLLLLFILINSNCSSHHDEAKTLNDAAKLTDGEADALIEKWIELWATYDLNLLDDIFYQSDQTTYFSSEKEGLIMGYDQLKPHHEGFGFLEGGKEAEKSLWLEDLETMVYGETATVAGVWYFGDKTLPKDSTQYGPVTFVLLKDDKNQAKIVHTHFANY